MATPDARRLPLSRELIALGRTLARPAALLTVVALSLLVVALAYQVRPGYALQAGSKTDAPFWQHVNDGEQEPATKATYRWTTDVSTLVLPGVGAGAYTVQLDLSGSRPAGFPAPVVDVLAGGQVLATLQPAPARQTLPGWRARERGRRPDRRPARHPAHPRPLLAARRRPTAGRRRLRRAGRPGGLRPGAAAAARLARPGSGRRAARAAPRRGGLGPRGAGGRGRRLDGWGGRFPRSGTASG